MSLPLFLLWDPKSYGWGEDVCSVLIAAEDEERARNMIKESEGNSWNNTTARCRQIGVSSENSPKIILICGAGIPEGEKHER